MNRRTPGLVALGFACLAAVLAASVALAAPARGDRPGKGWEMFMLGEYARAAAMFERAVRAAEPGSEEHLAALYGLATTYQLRESGRHPARATRLFEEVVRQAPRSEFAAWSLLALARIEYLVPAGKEPDRERVLAAYQRVIDAHPGHPAAQEAFIYQQALRISTLDRGEAGRCAAALASYAQGKAIYRGVAFSLIAQCHAILGDPERQLAAEIRAIEALGGDRDNPTLDMATQYWRIANLAEFELGDFQTARKYYGLLLKEYPRDQRGFGAERALERMDAIARTPKGGKP